MNTKEKKKEGKKEEGGKKMEKLTIKEVERLKVKKEKKENPVKVGDVFHSSWGYGMTINDFYKVIDVLGSKKIKLKQLKNKVLSGNGFAGEETFDKNEFKKDAEEFTRMVNTNYSTPTVKINSYNTAFKIDSEDDRTYYYNTLD